MKQTQVVSLIITEKCNLACKYCYVVEENVGYHNQKNIVMTDEVIHRAIPFIIYNIAPTCENLRIDLYGGESMLEFDKIKFFVERFEPFAKTEGVWDKTQILIFTNGTTATEEIMLWMKPYFPKVDFSFSVDGTENSQNSTRVYKDGSGSYSKVIENFELFKKIFDLPENESIHSRSVHTLSPDNIQYLMDTILDYKIQGISSYHTFLCKDDIWSPKDIEEYRKQRKLSTDFLIKEFPETGMMDKYMVLLMQRQRYKQKGECSSGKTLISITQNGDLYPCHRLYQGSRAAKFKIGDIWKGIDKTSTYLGTLEKLGIDTIKECINCKYGIRDSCNFQCTSARFESATTKGNIFKVIPSICELLYIDHQSAAALNKALSGNLNFEILFM